MSRKHINKQQVKLYMKYRKETGLNQDVSAAKVEMSIRTARKIDHGKHHTQSPQRIRLYKTRSCPLDIIWESELIPMLERNPDLQPKTLFLYLERTHQDESGKAIYKEAILRTLQRRTAIWKAIHGKEKEIMFPQVHMPGQQGLSDFTHFDLAEITIAGKPFKHMFYHFRLVYSKWSYLKIIRSGESFQALSEGLQEALYHLGGAPHEHRTDSLSAAFKNLSAEAKKDLTDQYEALCSYYQMVPTRNNKGEKHENGSVESSHGHLKNRIAQELILRGSYDFNSIAEYENWIHEIVYLSNRRLSKNFELEKQSLKPLPANKSIDFEIKSIKVTNLAILIIKNIRYSVPNQLSGHTITLHIYQHKIEGYLGCTLVLTLARKYQEQHKSNYVIDYHHVIHSLIKKPGAFRFCKYKNEILPNENYRAIWNYIDAIEPQQTAPKTMLRILKLAADYDCEAALESYLMNIISNKQGLNIEEIENQFNTSNPSLPKVECKQHMLADYDQLIQPFSTKTINLIGENYATS